MDHFCGDTFWGLTEDGYLSRCFERSVLAWIPCVFLWVFSPLELHYLITSKDPHVKRNLFNLTKLLASVLLFAVAVADLVNAVIVHANGDTVHAVDFVTPVIQLVSFAFSCVLLEANRRRGIASSAILYQFWLLGVICGTMRLRTLITHPQNESNFLRITFFVHFSLCACVLILSCWADKVSKQGEHEHICPERSASFLSRLTYSWFNKMAVLGHRRALEISDLWLLVHRERSENLVPLFDKYWESSFRKTERQNSKQTSEKDTQATKRRKVSIVPALWKAFGPTFLLGSFLKVLTDLNGFLNPVILQLLITFAWSDASVWRGVMYAGILFVNVTFTTVVLSQYFQRMFTVGLRIRSALISAIFRKSLRLCSSARRDTGELVNLMSVDAQRFMDLIMYFNMVWSNPLQFGLCFYLLWIKLGPSVLAGLAVLLLLIPVDVVIASRVRNLQSKQMQSKDKRVKLITEILNGIKVIKLQAWETVFANKVLKVRDKEVGLLKHSAYYDAANSFIWSFAPILVSLASFATFVLSSEENILDAETAFVSLTLFNMMRYSLTMFPVMITSLVQVSVSIERINKFMNLPEVDPNSVSHQQNEDPLEIEKGTFTWTHGQLPVLKDVSLRCKLGSLVAVLGGVGAGKSSLLAACLGDMEKLQGTVNTIGSIAYVPQVAWIQNASLRDNILFGKDFDQVTYDAIIEACALKPDIRILPAGDMTEIGEKGINLSGGQKQRVSLARALYSDADLVLLDDPLSAVDAHVANHIFRHVIGPQGLLKNKTRVVVTHGVSWLHEADHVINLKDGQISESGKYDELISRSGEFAEFMHQHRGEGSAQSVSDETMSEDIPVKMERKNLTEAEKIEVGKVKWSVYKYYSVSVGILLTVSTLLFHVLYQTTGVASNLWLSVWATKQTGNSTEQLENTEFYLGVYGAFGAAQALFVLLPCITLVIATVGAAVRLHSQMLNHTLRNPMSFFDTTPAGRVVNRFARDVDVVDNTLPVNIRTWLNSFFSVIATLVVISMTNNFFMVFIIPIGILYYFIQRFYIPSSRQLKRLESVTRSPIYSHFGEAVTGISSIRAYACENRFVQTSEHKVDTNQMPYYLSIIANRWLAIRLEMLGNLIIFLAALLSVLAREQMSPGMVGLSISYALQITATLNFLVRVTSDVETNIVAVERIKEYGETPQEAEWENADCKPAGEWPDKGGIQIEGYQMKYREDTELVLRGISCDIKPGEKVGVVGRTGAGKSSLALALFRLVESSNGRIIIDGVDISSLGLHDLRSRLTMIPQDPVLFSGSLRLNLDPLECHEDVDIWRVLELTHLIGVVRSMPEGMHHFITEGGENLSAGQRQLVCLARALLSKSKILVLDEATGAVDLDTDDLVQKTIREEFKESSVLTIAHRLNTVVDYDRVLVLDNGHVIESDSPQNLLQNQHSVFYAMAKQAGIIK